jgi:pseudomonalisin
LGLPVPPVTVINAGIPNPDTSGNIEWNLDTQASVGLAGNVSRLYLYVASSFTDTDLTFTFNKFVAQKLAKAGNGSFGLCEVFPFIDGNMLADDNIFLEAAAQGQNVFFSTGDTGSFCGAVVGTNGVPAGAPFVEVPAASTYAVAVGGTSLFTNADGTYNNEIAWYAGGGISQFEAAGYWQAAAVPSSNVNSKGLPDISMDADPFSGFNTYYSCAVTSIPPRHALPRGKSSAAPVCPRRLRWAFGHDCKPPTRTSWDLPLRSFTAAALC